MSLYRFYDDRVIPVSGVNGAVGKVYSGTLSATGKNNTIDGGKRYNAIVLYASTWVSATVTHSGGTFYID